MSDVSLSVGGRNYSVACADGQEDHVRRLAGVVDAKLGSLGGRSSQEAKNLLFVALLLADELEEARNSSPAQSAPDHDADQLAGRLDRVAMALENAASTLEGGDVAS